MSGMTLTSSVISKEALEIEYGITEKQQIYLRTKLNMPFHRVSEKLIFYTRRDIDAWIKSFDKNGHSSILDDIETKKKIADKIIGK